MRAGKITILLLLLLLAARIAFAQAYWESYELYDTRNGMPNNAVLTMVQDNRKLLWLGTRNGLCVYDGSRFDVKEEPRDTTQKQFGKIINCLFKDSRGNIWVATENGGSGVYPADSAALRRCHIGGLAHNEYVTCYGEGAGWAIWAGTNYGNLFVTKGDVGIFVRKDSLGVFIRTIVSSGPDGLLINGEPFHGAATAAKPGAVSARRLRIAVSGDTLHIINKGGSETIVTERELLGQGSYVTFVTGDDRVIIATNRLIKEYSAGGSLLSRIVIGSDFNDNEDVANFVFEDASGIIWIGTNFGLIKVNKHKYRFEKFAANSPWARLNSNYIRSVFVDNKGGVWLGYKKGLINRLQIDSGGGAYHLATIGYRVAEVPHAAINVIRQLGTGEVLCGGLDGLFVTGSRKGNDVPAPLQRYPVTDSSGAVMTITEVWSILEAGNGLIWVSTRCDGLFVIDPVTHKSRRYAYKENRLATCWQVFQDHNGTIWLATEDGLDSVTMDAQYHPLGFYHLHDNYGGHCGRHVWSIVEDTDQNLWIGTTDGGFARVDKGLHMFVPGNKAGELPGEKVCGMLCDRRNRLWISTQTGIFRYDINTGDLLRFSESDGLIGNDYNFNACYKSSSGAMFFGSKSGLVAFSPDSIGRVGDIAAAVVIRYISTGGEVQQENPPAGGNVELQPGQQALSIRFALPDFGAPASLEFAYQLEGFDDHWTTTDTRHPVASYTNLPPGKYTFLVRAVDGGKVLGMPASLFVSIRPTVWQMPLVRAGLVILVICSIALWMYLRFRLAMARAKERHLNEQKFAALELRALRAQINPHFIFNAINAIQHFMLTSDELTANAYLSGFARLMRLYYESSRNRYIPLADEIELLRLYVGLEKLRFEDKFDFSFSVDPVFDDVCPEIPSMLLQPYVENAINHGLALRSTKGDLKISFRLVGNDVLCEIDDNGVGRAEARMKRRERGDKRRGSSTDTICDRIDAYRKVDQVDVSIKTTDKTDVTGKSRGTRVEILIPDII